VEVRELYVRDSLARSHAELHEGRYVLLTVRDTGIGMDASVQQRVFEPFFTTKPPGLGSGLGLAVVHGIMRQHSGAVLLKSDLGQGTTVDCYFPIQEVEDVGEHGVIEREERGRGEHVLCIDDEAALLDVVRRRLERLGYRVTTSSDARGAVDLLRSRPHDFDLVLVDYTMPTMTGLDVARAVADLRPHVPVVLVTGVVDDLPASKLTEAGVELVVRKPLTRAELGRTVRRGLSRRDSRDRGGRS
jgi:CheY-like chemotaxis protein